MSNGALFHRFASKEAIAAALYVESIRSFQEWHWQMLADRPASFREAVHAIVTHHLTWVQDHQDQARFLYDRGHLDWRSDEIDELTDINRRLVAAYRGWLGPFVAAGEVRGMGTLVFTSILAGPAHAIAQRWLESDRALPLTRHIDELAHAAWAGLATPEALAGSAPQPRAAAAGVLQPETLRVRVQLIGEDGEPVGEAHAVLDPPAEPA